MQEKVEKFIKYTNKYRDMSHLCILKIHHTFRVMNLCEQISKKLKFTEEEIYLATISGLLHDIGRFEQWNRFKTFTDRDSIDHADLGYEILLTDNLISQFTTNKRHQEIILKSVKYHNKYCIPNNLTDMEEKILKVVRDADKIDILYLYTIEEIKINIDLSSISADIYKNIKNHELVNLKNKKTKSDALSVSLAFVFDINYVESLKILKEKNYLNKEIEIYQNKNISKELSNQLSETKQIIEKYMNRKICNQKEK